MLQPTPDTLAPLASILTEGVPEVVIREHTALDHLLTAKQNRCVIFGSGTLGRKAVSLFREIGVEPLAMVDSNSARWGTRTVGITVLSPADAAAQFGADSVFFVTIWNDFHWFRDTFAKLTALGCTSVSSYAPIFWKFGPRFMDLRLLNEEPHKLYDQLADVFAAESLWADEESLQTYRSNILWRALGDPTHLPFPAPQNTYFPRDIFQLTPDESIADCGAFDGDTIRFVVGLVGSDFGAIHAIEADLLSIEKLNAYIATLPPAIAAKVHCHDCAVGAERCTLRFSMSGAATSSRVDDEGIDVPCVPIDELFLDTHLSLIKMDIEGAEYDALVGAAKTIARDLPVLAICVYHTQNDIWRIPLLLKGQYPTYRFFLRSYDGDGFQTVLYAIPPERFLPSSR